MLWNEERESVTRSHFAESVGDESRLLEMRTLLRLTDRAPTAPQLCSGFINPPASLNRPITISPRTPGINITIPVSASSK